MEKIFLPHLQTYHKDGTTSKYNDTDLLNGKAMGAFETMVAIGLGSCLGYLGGVAIARAIKWIIKKLNE